MNNESDETGKKVARNYSYLYKYILIVVVIIAIITLVTIIFLIQQNKNSSQGSTRNIPYEYTVLGVSDDQVSLKGPKGNLVIPLNDKTTIKGLKSDTDSLQIGQKVKVSLPQNSSSPQYTIEVQPGVDSPSITLYNNVPQVTLTMHNVEQLKKDFDEVLKASSTKEQYEAIKNKPLDLMVTLTTTQQENPYFLVERKSKTFISYSYEFKNSKITIFLGLNTQYLSRVNNKSSLNAFLSGAANRALFEFFKTPVETQLKLENKLFQNVLYLSDKK